MDQISKAHWNVLRENKSKFLSPRFPGSFLPSSLEPVLLSPGFPVLLCVCRHAPLLVVVVGNGNLHLYSAVDAAYSWYTTSFDPPNNCRVDVLCL